MRRMFTPFAVVLLLLLTPKTYSQIVWTFSDGTAAPSANSYQDITVSDMTSNNNTGSGNLTAVTNSSSSNQYYSNHSGTYNIGAAADTSFTRGFDAATSAYFEFTLTSTSATAITSIGFGNRATSTGPAMLSIRTSLDGYTTDLASDTMTNNSSWNAKFFTFTTLTLGAPVTIRIYGYSGQGKVSTGTINWRIDDITINGGSVLPVSLKNFTASVISNKVQLSWTIASEVNLKGYSVEKSSDGRAFSEVSYVAASGKGSYSAQDAVSSNAVYYRLKMVNNDGSFTYSKNIPVNASVVSSSSLRIYPNPVVTTAMVSHPSAGASASLKVTDLNGRVLQSYSLQQGAVQTQIIAGKLISGTYLIVYRDASGNVASTRFVKQ